MPACQGEKKIECAIRIYQEIIAWYKKALSISEINQKLLEFDELFPEYKWFSKTKKTRLLIMANAIIFSKSFSLFTAYQILRGDD